MTGADQIMRFATLGNHLPRHCGIATFTTHLTDALVEQLPNADGFVIAMNDAGRRHAYPSRVRFEIGEGVRLGWSQERDDVPERVMWRTVQKLCQVGSKRNADVYGVTSRRTL